jgi:four helix bundle protein
MHRYEQLQLWQRGCALAVRVYDATRGAASGADRSLAWQMRRAASSVPANVAEGATRGSVMEFAQFLAIAAGSAAELHSHAEIAGAAGMVESSAARAIADESVALRRMAVALRNRMKGSVPKSAHSHPEPP